MIPLMAANKNPNPESAFPFPAPADDGTPRCALTEDGAIAYANAPFYALADIAPDDRKPESAADIFRFADSHLVVLERLDTIAPGLHSVYFRNNPAPVPVQFDWLSAPDRTRYLIVSVPATAKALPKTPRPVSEGVLTDWNDLLEFSGITHDVMIVADSHGSIIRANSAFFRQFGYTPIDLPGLPFADLLPAEDRDAILAKLLDSSDGAEKNEAVQAAQSLIRTKTGETRWMAWQRKHVQDLAYIAGRDITAIQQQQDDLARRQKQLSEAEAIGRMGHWRWAVGQDGIAWSDELYRIFGLDPDTFTPTFGGLGALIHPEDVERLVQGFQRAVIEKKDYDMEFRIQRPNGDIRYILCEGRCEKDADSDVIALYGIMQDMTERMLYEEELRRARDAAERAYAAKSQFLANMSHELRTPLNAIIGFSEIMEKQIFGTLGNEKYMEYATGIRESGAHLLDLIGDILDMSKIEAGKYELDFESLDLADIIKRAVSMVESRAKQKNIALDIDYKSCKNLEVIADRRGLIQILLNLLSNAIKFTGEGGAVSLSCARQKNHFTLGIADTGIGIPPNKLASVLRPFEQVSSHYTRDHEGTGLGLSITKELIEIHGGKISIDSAVGIGTTVTVRLPYDTSKKRNRL